MEIIILIFQIFKIKKYIIFLLYRILWKFLKISRSYYYWCCCCCCFCCHDNTLIIGFIFFCSHLPFSCIVCFFSLAYYYTNSICIPSIYFILKYESRKWIWSKVRMSSITSNLNKTFNVVCKSESYKCLRWILKEYLF